MTDQPGHDRDRDRTPSFVALGLGVLGGALLGKAAWNRFPAMRKVGIETAGALSDLARQASIGYHAKFPGGLPFAPGRFLRGGIVEQLREMGTIGQSAELAAAARKALEPTYGVQRGIATPGYRNLTISDVLNNARRTPGYGGQYYNIGPDRLMAAEDVLNLRRAYTSGVVGSGWSIDPHTYVRGIGQDLAIREAGMLNARQTMANIVRWGREFTFFGASPFDIIPRGWEPGLAIGRLSSQIPINIAGRGLVAPGGDYALQLGRNVYSMQGRTPQYVGETAGKIYTGRSVVRHRLGQLGLAGRDITEEGVTLQSTLAQRMKAYPERYQGTMGKVRRFFENVGERWGIGPQYAHYESLGGTAYKAWERLTTGKVPISLRTGAQGAGAFAGGRIERTMGRAGITPARDISDVFWATKEEARLPLSKVRELARVKRPSDTILRMPIAGDRVGNINAVSMTPKEAASAQVRRLLTTPLATAEWATGLGVKPGTAGEMMWTMFAKGVIPAWLGWEALKYIDYASGGVISPIKWGAGLYAGGMTARQAALNVTGFSAVANRLDEITGGLFNTYAGVAMRSAGILGAGIALGRQGLPAAPWLALGAATLQATTEPGQPATELWEEYTGKREVPVRRGRGWFMPGAPLGGADIMYYRHHAVAQILGDEHYAQYGGKAEYFKNVSLLPTPSNIFGVRNLIDPYAHEKSRYWEQPYPVSRGWASDVPLAGPALNLTLGRILKPRRIMHYDELREYYEGYQASFMGEPGMADVAQALGLPVEQQAVPAPRFGAAQELGMAMKGATEYLGLPGFMVGAIKEQVTGSEDWFLGGPIWETPDYTVSPARTFYEAQMGGMLGTSEPLRRLIYKRPYQVDYVNPVHNTLPDWMPGSRSSFGDTDWIDWQTGDPFARMPGNTAYKLGPIFEGAKLDAFGKWDLLSGLAPFAQATKYYDQIINQAGATGALSPWQQDRYNELQSQMPLHWAMTGVAGPWGTAHGASSVLPNIPYVSSKFLGARSAFDSYRANVLYGSNFQDWKHPWSQMLDPYLSMQSSESFPEALYGGAALGMLGRNPGSGKLFAGVGMAYTGVQNLLGPSISAKEESRELTEEYFDKMKYLKLRRLEEVARGKGRDDIAQRMQRMQTQTMAGLDYGGTLKDFYMNAYRALPKRDRPYLAALAGDQSTDISQLPSYMQPIVSRLASQKYEGGGGTSQRMADFRSAEWMMERGGIPDADWGGWSPTVRTQDVKLISMAAEGANLHDYGGYEPSVTQTAFRMPQIQPVEIYSPDLLRMGRSRYAVNSMLRRLGIAKSSVMVDNYPSGDHRMSFNMQRDRSRDARDWDRRGRW